MYVRKNSDISQMKALLTVCIIMMLITPVYSDNWLSKDELQEKASRGVLEGSYLIRAANAGDREAQYHLGQGYHHGVYGLPKNAQLSHKWYLSAANLGHVKSQLYAGSTEIKNGNHSGGLQRMLSAHDQGDMVAAYIVAKMYKNGEYLDLNEREALRWFKKSAEIGWLDSQYELGAIYEKGRGTDINLVEAEKWYKIAAANGSSKASQKLEAMFIDNLARAESQPTSEIIHQSGNGKDRSILNRLSDFFSNRSNKCRGVFANTDLSLLHEKADEGCANAQYHLGYRYTSGYPETQVLPEEGEKWTKMAIENGSLDAMSSLATMKLNGHHHYAVDIEEGMELLERAAKLGHRGAASSLVFVYLKGKHGVSIDYEKALKLNRDVLSYELDENLYFIAEYLFSNNHYIDSKIWMERAALQGHAEAKVKIKNFNSLVSQRVNNKKPSGNNTVDPFNIILGLIAIGVAMENFNTDSENWSEQQREQALEAENKRIKTRIATDQAVGWALVK